MSIFSAAEGDPPILPVGKILLLMIRLFSTLLILYRFFCCIHWIFFMLLLKFFFFFSIWVFFHEHSWITGLQGKGEGISLTPHYHFHPLHRHLDISRTITAESSPLHIASCRTRTGSLWFPSASSLLSYNYFQFFLSLLLVQSKHLKPWWYLIFHIDGAQHYPSLHVQ